MSNKCDQCGSYAINHHSHGRDGSEPDLCDVCFWRNRHDQLKAECDRRSGLVKHYSALNFQLINEKAELRKQLDEARELLLRYRSATPLGNQPYMIAGAVDAWLEAHGNE